MTFVLDYTYLSVSNGSGDAALMHVTGTRLTGATTIAVDGVTNVPAKFVATYGTLGSDGLITPSSKRDIAGHTSGGALVIDAFLPGSTDGGNTAGQVVVIKPNTSWADTMAALAQVGHNADGTHKSALPLTSPVLTTPRVVTSFNDLNGNELFKVSPILSAVNELTVQNAATGNAPQLAATGGDTDISWVLKGKGAGKVLAQLPVQQIPLSGGTIGTTETVVGTVSIPAYPVAVTVILMAAFEIGWTTGAPSWLGSSRIRKTNLAGTAIGGMNDTKFASTGINNTGHTTILTVDNVAANTAQAYVATFQTDSNAAGSIGGSLIAVVVAQ